MNGVYIMSQNETRTRSFCDNLGKYEVTDFNTHFALLYFEMNMEEVIATSFQICSRTTLQNLKAEQYNFTIYTPCRKGTARCRSCCFIFNSKVMQNRLFAVNFYKDVIFSIAFLYHLITILQHCSKYPLSSRTCFESSTP